MKSVQLFFALASISLASGVALGGLYELTYERAENNVLKFKKIPAVAGIYAVVEGALSPERRLSLEQELLADKRYLDVGAKKKLLLFPVKKEGDTIGVTVEEYGQGFGGKVGVLVGVELASGNLLGVGITTMSETPGVGTRVLEPAFIEQFAGLAPQASAKIKKDGGIIDGVTGATVTSRAVADGVTRARALFNEHRAAIVEAASRPAAPVGGPTP